MSLHILIHCILPPRPRFSNALGTQTKSVDWLFVPAAGKAAKHWHSGMNCFGHTSAWLPLMPSFAGTAHMHDGIPELSTNRYGHMAQAGLIRFFFLRVWILLEWYYRLNCVPLKCMMEKEMATHSSILAWRISWTEEPGGLLSMGSPRFRHNWATNTLTFRMLKTLMLEELKAKGKGGNRG